MSFRDYGDDEPGMPYILTPEGRAAYMKWLARQRAKASEGAAPKGAA